VHGRPSKSFSYYITIGLRVSLGCTLRVTYHAADDGDKKDKDRRRAPVLKASGLTQITDRMQMVRHKKQVYIDVQKKIRDSEPITT